MRFQRKNSAVARLDLLVGVAITSSEGASCWGVSGGMHPWKILKYGVFENSILGLLRAFIFH